MKKAPTSETSIIFSYKNQPRQKLSFVCHFYNGGCSDVSTICCFLRPPATSFCSSELDIRSTSKALSSFKQYKQTIQCFTTKDQKMMFLKTKLHLLPACSIHSELPSAFRFLQYTAPTTTNISPRLL